MDIAEVAAALSDRTRLRLLEIIHDKGPISSKRAHEEFVRRFDDRRRESIYKALEKLVDAGILVKTYDREGEGLVYEIAYKRVIIDLHTLEIQAE